MNIEAVWELAAAAITEFGDTGAVDEILRLINVHLEAGDIPGADARRAAAIMIEEMLGSLPH